MDKCVAAIAAPSASRLNPVARRVVIRLGPLAATGTTVPCHPTGLTSLLVTAWGEGSAATGGFCESLARSTGNVTRTSPRTMPPTTTRPPHDSPRRDRQKIPPDQSRRLGRCSRLVVSRPAGRKSCRTASFETPPRASLVSLLIAVAPIFPTTESDGGNVEQPLPSRLSGVQTGDQDHLGARFAIRNPLATESQGDPRIRDLIRILTGGQITSELSKIRSGEFRLHPVNRAPGRFLGLGQQRDEVLRRQ